MEGTKFGSIFDRFYSRIEKDEHFFDYYNVNASEAVQIATKRANHYLMDALDTLSSVGDLEVDFSDYDVETQQINFELYPKELIVEIMYLEYMKRDESLLHAMEINFTPSDLSVFSPANERNSYRNFINDLTNKIEIMIDNYKNRDRATGVLKNTIDYTLYGEE